MDTQVASNDDILDGFLELFVLVEASEHLTAEELWSFNELLLCWERVLSEGENDLGRTSLMKHELKW